MSKIGWNQIEWTDAVLKAHFGLGQSVNEIEVMPSSRKSLSQNMTCPARSREQNKKLT